MKNFKQESINGRHILNIRKTINLPVQERPLIPFQEETRGLKELPPLQPAGRNCPGTESSHIRDCKGCPFIKDCLGKKKKEEKMVAPDGGRYNGEQKAA